MLLNLDIDECIEELHSCDNGNCSNTEGSFICNCFSGFRENGILCEG